MPKIVINTAIRLEEYLQKLGFQTSLPVHKYRAIVNKEELRKDEKQYPLGERDWRGEHNLYPNMSINTEPHTLDIVFIGNGHVPYFHQQLREEALNPFIVSDHHFIEPDEYISLLMLRSLRKYPIVSSSGGKPILIVGHKHDEEYSIPFPSIEDITNLGISEVFVHAEFVTKHGKYGTEDGMLMQLRQVAEEWNGFKPLYAYVIKLKEAGISRLEGIDTVEGLGGILKKLDRPS